jgi:hypothetical protein
VGLSPLEKGEFVKSSSVDEHVEEEGVFTPKSTNAFLRGEKRSICKNCGVPVVEVWLLPTTT